MGGRERYVGVAERRARLALRHRLAGPVRGAAPEEIADALVALHGTDPATVYLAVGARLADAARTVPETNRALYEYRSLSDDELQQYADFLASDAGRWYSATMSKAMIRTVALAAQKTASEMARALPPQRWSGAATASPQH